MEKHRLTIIISIAVALVWSMMLTGLIGIFILAMIGATVTAGLITGSLAPVYPTVSRANAPRTFWAVMLVCAAVLTLNIVNLLWRN